jgi:hypothetical protein|tara:strand:+ start:786 stop:1169 length:384 start_codon:yes stop_codon:yes gene_type:complete
MAWTDEKRALVISEYSDTMANEYDNDIDRAAASVEIVKELAETHEETVNGVRMILNKAEVYIKKTAAPKSASKEGGTKRVNKAEAIATLKELIISAAGEEAIQDDILDKMTGKAAMYFAGILQPTVS